VALENISIIEREGLVERAAEMGAYLLKSLRGLEHHPTFWDARGLGLLTGVELVADSSGRLFRDPAAFGTALRRRCTANGLITLPLHPGNVMFFTPPLTISRGEIDELVEIFDQSLTETERRLGEFAA
jgi:adenosylmethionine-8-amino-7-oxononanoate aminotransferase